jgi:hypothetical protein
LTRTARASSSSASSAVLSQQVARQRIAPEIVRKGIAALTQPRQLLAPLGDQFVLVECLGGG